MRRLWKFGIPAFAAVVVLLIATFVEFRITVAGRSDYYVDIAFNGILICIAVLSAILVGLPTKAQHELRLVGFLSNLLVPILAFPMNIAVFGHKINWSDPLKELWDGHIGWLFCATLQILFLSGLGEFLMSGAKRFFMWLKQIANILGRGFCAIGEFIRTHDKGIIAIMTTSIIVWVVFLVSRVYHAGTCEILADADTFAGSLMVWITCVLTGAIAYTAPFLFRQLEDAVKSPNSRKIFMVGIVIIALAVLCLVLLKTAGPLVTWFVIPTCLAVLIVAGVIRRIRKKRQLIQQGKKTTSAINSLDLIIALLAFFIIPLMLLNGITAFSSQGQEILSRGQINMTNILDYITACCNVASAMIQMFV